MDKHPLTGTSQDRESLLGLENYLQDAIQLFRYAHTHCEYSIHLSRYGDVGRNFALNDDCRRISVGSIDQAAVNKTSIIAFDLAEKVKQAFHDALVIHPRQYKGVPLQRIGRISVFYLFTLSCHYFSVRRCITENDYHPGTDTNPVSSRRHTSTSSDPFIDPSPSVSDLWARLAPNYADIPPRDIYVEKTVENSDAPSLGFFKEKIAQTRIPLVVMQPLNSYAEDLHWSEGLERTLGGFEWHARPLVERHRWAMRASIETRSSGADEERDTDIGAVGGDTGQVPPDEDGAEWI